MKPSEPPSISSFVIRFVVEQAVPEAETPVYHGAIRHVQSAEEVNFTAWPEAVAFMRRFVPLENELRKVS